MSPFVYTPSIKIYGIQELKTLNLLKLYVERKYVKKRKVGSEENQSGIV